MVFAKEPGITKLYCVTIIGTYIVNILRTATRKMLRIVVQCRMLSVEWSRVDNVSWRQGRSRCWCTRGDDQSTKHPTEYG